jgi:hypothetical protein
MVNSQQAAACSGASASQGRSSDTPPARYVAPLKHSCFTDSTSGRIAVGMDAPTPTQHRTAPAAIKWCSGLGRDRMLHTRGGGRAGCEARVQQPVPRAAVQRRQGLQRQPQHRAVRQRLRAAAFIEVLAPGAWSPVHGRRAAVGVSAEGRAARSWCLASWGLPMRDCSPRRPVKQHGGVPKVAEHAFQHGCSRSGGAPAAGGPRRAAPAATGTARACR